LLDRHRRRLSFSTFRRGFIQSEEVMKTKTVFILIAVTLAGSVIAQKSLVSFPVYTALEAQEHVGETATITGRVDGVHRSGKGNILLNMGGTYPNQAFTAFIPGKSARQFSDYQKYDGKTVAVSGKITLYRGKPQIVVTSQSQVSMH